MNNSPEYRIVSLILQRGNQPGLIAEWFAGMAAWADANTGKDAGALRVWLKLAKPRPFYTANELAPMIPALMLALGLSDRLLPRAVPNRLHNVLQFYGLPLVKNVNGTTHFPGMGTFFIVEHCHKWRDRELTIEELRDVLAGKELP